MARMTFWNFSICCIAILTLLTSTVTAKPYFSAKCLQQTPRCKTKIARRSMLCLPMVALKDQTEECIQEACKYCMVGKRIKIFPCKKRIVRKTCESTVFSSAPSPTSSTTNSASPTATISTSSSMTSSPSSSITPTPSSSMTMSMVVSMSSSSSPTASMTMTVSPSGSTSFSPSMSMNFVPTTSPSLTLTQSSSTTMSIVASSSSSPTASMTMTMPLSVSPSFAPSMSMPSVPTTSPSFTVTISMTLAPSMFSAPTGACYWPTLNGAAVIPLSAFVTASGWTPVTRDGYSGLGWEMNKISGINSAGRKGVMCVTILPEEDGKYYFTGLSYAPDSKDHNDVWVRSSNGFELWKAGTEYERKIPGEEWRKAYSNFGPKGISQDFKTEDFRGYRFLIPKVQKGVPFEVCISGRSSKFEVYNLIVKKCIEKFCTGRVDRNVINMDTTNEICN